MIPKLVGNTNTDASEIFEECSEGGWKAKEGSTGDEANVVIDMGCPIKVQNIQLTNGAEYFRTNQFSFLSSLGVNGPWNKLLSETLRKDDNEVKYKFLRFFFRRQF